MYPAASPSYLDLLIKALTVLINGAKRCDIESGLTRLSWVRLPRFLSARWMYLAATAGDDQ